MKNRFIMLLLMTLIIIVIIGCPRKTGYGAPIRSDLKYEQVSDILSNPDQFIDKEVGLKGKITLECGSGCWFQLNDGTGEILVDLAPANFAIPQMPEKMVTVMGKVVKDEERIVVHASGVQF